MKKLDVYVLAKKFVPKAYRLTHNFAKIETFGLSSQLRRAAYSTPLNIAEGPAIEHKRTSNIT